MLLEWASKASRKYVSRELSAEIRKAAEPFVKWLREAEEEEDSTEESEDDVEVSVLVFGMERMYRDSQRDVRFCVVDRLQ